MLSACKSTLSEQHQRISAKHAADLELIDDLRAFLQKKAAIEKSYAESLIKLCSQRMSASHKKYPLKLSSEEGLDERDPVTVYTAWHRYVEELEGSAKGRIAAYDNYNSMLDQLKGMRNHKIQVAKKQIDQHLK